MYIVICKVVYIMFIVFKVVPDTVCIYHYFPLLISSIILYSFFLIYFMINFMKSEKVIMFALKAV